MKQLCSFILVLSFCQFLHAQNVGIGTNIPNNSAILELSSTNKGLLLPRVADTSSVTAPVKGLQVYSLASNKLWYHDGTRWMQSGNGNSGDTIWQMKQDTIAYTNKKYVSINTDLINPIQEGLQARGSLLVQGKLIYSSTTPTAAQIYTMTNLPATQDIPGADSVFRIYDPGGTGNYNNNMQGNIHLNSSTYQVGYKITSTAADFGLGTGDTLWLSQFGFPSCRTTYSYRFTNTTANPGDMIVTGVYYVIFRSNADGNNSKGFNFTFTRLNNRQEEKTIETAGPALLFNGVTGSFAAGTNAGASGRDAVAFGQMNKANGSGSFAFGFLSTANASQSIAGGYSNRADGHSSIALGSTNYAGGDNSLALGSSSSAENSGSVAIGSNVTVTGDYATGFGAFSEALGDYSTVFGNSNRSEGKHSVAMGNGIISRGYASTVVGMYNDPLLSYAQNDPSGFTPLFIIGDGDDASNRSNAMVVMRGGNVGIGYDNPAYKLEVNGSEMIRNDNRPSLQIRKTNNVGGLVVITEEDDMEIGTNVWNTTGKLLFTLNNDVKLTIDVDGDATLKGNATFNKSSNTTLSLQANDVEKGFVQLNGNDLRMGTYSSNSTGRIILRSSGSDQLVIGPTGDATLAGDLTVRGNRGVLINGASGSTLKYYTRTVGVATNLPAFGYLDNIDIPFAAGMFAVAPEVMVGDVVSTGGASGELLRTQLIIYNVTATGCKGKVINTSNGPINYSTTWNISCIGR